MYRRREGGLISSVKLNCFHCCFTLVIEYSHSWRVTGFESKGLLHLFESYCALLCFDLPSARSCATCVFFLKWGLRLRPCCQCALLHHQPASFKHSLIVKLGWYSAHHKLRSVTFAPVYHYNYYV